MCVSKELSVLYEQSTIYPTKCHQLDYIQSLTNQPTKKMGGKIQSFN